MGKQQNAQREVALLAEWLAAQPPGFKSKTNIRVGVDTLIYGGPRLSPAVARAFAVWSDRVDARVFTGREVWLVEAKLVATAGAYGQVLDYANQYPYSDDYRQFSPSPIVPVVVAQATRARTALLFAQYGVRTVQFTPSFDLEQSLGKLFQGAEILSNDGKAPPVAPADIPAR